MKKTWILLVLLFLNFNLMSQDWVYDIAEAKDKAALTGNRIVLVFQGSDWCAPCMKLDKEIWSTEKFKSQAPEKYVMLKADFPRRKKNKLSAVQESKNGALAEKYNPHGHFPLVVILNAEGEVLGSLGYEKTTPEEYMSKIDSF